MPIRNRYPFIPGSRFFAFAVALVWLSCGGSARAGDGGSELVGPLKKVLNDTCSMLNITSCPSQLTTVNQLVVEIAALRNTTPSDVRASALGVSIPPGGAVDGGTHNGVVTPLAFISPPNKTEPPVPTPPTNPAANSFISAAFSNGTVNFTFNYLPRTISPFNLDQEVGDIGLPVAVIDMNGNLQREVSADLQIFGAGGPCPGPTTCVTTQVVADLGGTGPQTFTKIKDQLDIDFSLDFSGTGGSEVIKLGVPLIEIDNLLGFAAPGFEFDTINRLFYGIDPAPTDHLTASFLNDANDPPAVFANLAVSRDGDTVLSSPGLPEPSTLALLASGVVGLGLVLSLRRRSTPDRSVVA